MALVTFYLFLSENNCKTKWFFLKEVTIDNNSYLCNELRKVRFCVTDEFKLQDEIFEVRFSKHFIYGKKVFFYNWDIPKKSPSTKISLLSRLKLLEVI